MYPSQVAEKLGIVGTTLRYEADLIAYSQFEKQRSKIEDNLQKLDELQIDSLQNWLNEAKAGKFSAHR